MSTKPHRATRIYPCGLQVQSFFNDSFEVLGVTPAGGDVTKLGLLEPAPLDDSGIAWQSDLERFKNPTEPEVYPEPSGNLWLYERFPATISEATGVHNPHFANWMRLSSFSDVRKIYGIINRNLKKGDMLHLKITPRFPLPKGARKEFVLATLNTFGSINNAFAWFFLVFGIYTLVNASCVCCVHGVILPHLRRRAFELHEYSDDDDTEEDSFMSG